MASSSIPARGAALDFIRVNLFDPRDMRVLPLSAPGPDNDLNEKIDQYVQRAMADQEALVYAFGERWGAEQGTTDKIFGFSPGNGVHDIHMNQGNVGRFTGDDGVYQDGALLFNFPRTSQWVGVFLPNKGGIITLLNERGLRVDGVAYTREQARNPGWTLKF